MSIMFLTCGEVLDGLEEREGFALGFCGGERAGHHGQAPGGEGFGRRQGFEILALHPRREDRGFEIGERERQPDADGAATFIEVSGKSRLVCAALLRPVQQSSPIKSESGEDSGTPASSFASRVSCGRERLAASTGSPSAVVQ